MLHTQLCGSTAAVLHYNCLSRIIALLAWRALNIPCEGYYDDFGMVLPECLIERALHAFAGFNKALLINLKEKKSEFGTFLEFLGLTVSFRGDGGHIIASLSLAAEKIQKLVELVRGLATREAVL